MNVDAFQAWMREAKLSPTALTKLVPAIPQASLTAWLTQACTAEVERTVRHALAAVVQEHSAMLEWERAAMAVEAPLAAAAPPATSVDAWGQPVVDGHVHHWCATGAPSCLLSCGSAVTLSPSDEGGAHLSALLRACAGLSAYGTLSVPPTLPPVAFPLPADTAAEVRRVMLSAGAAAHELLSGPEGSASSAYQSWVLLQTGGTNGTRADGSSRPAHAVARLSRTWEGSGIASNEVVVVGLQEGGTGGPAGLMAAGRIRDAASAAWGAALAQATRDSAHGSPHGGDTVGGAAPMGHAGEGMPAHVRAVQRCVTAYVEVTAALVAGCGGASHIPGMGPPVMAALLGSAHLRTALGLTTEGGTDGLVPGPASYLTPLLWTWAHSALEAAEVALARASAAASARAAHEVADAGRWVAVNVTQELSVALARVAEPEVEDDAHAAIAAAQAAGGFAPSPPAGQDAAVLSTARSWLVSTAAVSEAKKSLAAQVRAASSATLPLSAPAPALLSLLHRTPHVQPALVYAGVEEDAPLPALVSILQACLEAVQAATWAVSSVHDGAGGGRARVLAAAEWLLSRAPIPRALALAG